MTAGLLGLAFSVSADDFMHTYNTQFSTATMDNVGASNHSVKLSMIDGWWDPSYDPDWWNTSYRFRRQISISNESTSNSIGQSFPVKMQLNLSDMVSLGRLREDANDLRVAYRNTTTNSWVECPVYVDRANGNYFDGADDYIALPATAGTAVTDATIEFSFKRVSAWDGSSVTDEVLFYDYQDASNELKIAFAGTAGGDAGSLVVRGTFGGTQAFNMASTTISWAANQWYHAAVVFGTGGALLFINGIQQSSDTDTQSLGDLTPASIELGRNPADSEYFKGILDEFRLSSFRRYASTFTPTIRPFFSDSSTVCLLHMDEETGTIAYDASTNNNSATLVNGCKPVDGYYTYKVTTTNDVWFKTPANTGITAGDIECNYFLYYGNPTAGTAGMTAVNVFDIADDFSVDPAINDNWEIILKQMGVDADEALWDPVNRYWSLTTAVSNRGSGVYAKYDMAALDGWEASFDYRIGGGTGTGAKGIAFVFYDRGTNNTYGPSTPQAGDFTWAVEFDAFADAGDPSAQHISVVSNNGSAVTHLASVDDTRVEDDVWHKALIRFYNDNITVRIDEDPEPEINYTFGSFQKDYKYFGFTASTGSPDNNNHIISNVRFRQYVSPEPFVYVGGETDRLTAGNSWGFRHPLIIQNNSAFVLPRGSVIKLTFDHQTMVANNQSLDSGNDVRIVYVQNGNFTELTRTAETAWNTASTEISFRTANEIAASPGADSSYYLYFDNINTGSPPANEPSLYIFYDDFSYYGLDTTKWLAGAVNTVTHGIDSGKLRITDATVSGSTYWIDDNTKTGSQIKAESRFPSSFALEWTSSISNTSAGNRGQAGMAFTDSDSLVHAYLAHSDDSTGTINTLRQWLLESTAQSESGNADEEVTFKMVKNDSTVRYYVNGVEKYSGSLTGLPVAFSITAGTFGGAAFLDYCDIDDVTIQPYYDTNPTLTLQTVEGPFSLSGSIESALFNAGDVNTAIESVGWTNSGTTGTLTVRVRANNDSDWLTANPNADWYEITANGENPPVFGKYLQYRILFQGPGTDQGPILDDITIGYNLQPTTPINISPVAGEQIVTSTPLLQGNAFTDPNGDDTHSASRWQIRLAGSTYNNPVWDSGTTAANLTSATVPDEILADGYTYYWRVAYMDEHSDWTGSAWSDYSNESAMTVNLSGAAYDDAPTAPALNGPTAEEILTDINAPILSWAEVSAASGVVYEVQIDKTGIFAGDLDFTTTTGANFTDTVSLYNGNYYWRVRAIAGTVNAGPWSAVWMFTINAADNDPPEPGNTVTNPTGNTTPTTSAAGGSGSHGNVCFLKAILPKKPANRRN